MRTSARRRRLSLAAARRIALAAQGFSSLREPASPPGLRQLLAAVHRLGLLQLDSVNVFCRAHYLPLFSRLGRYDRAVLDRICAHGEGRIDRRLIEYWAHEASLIPIERLPLLRWRMSSTEQAWDTIRRFEAEHPRLLAETLELVRTNGPVRARDTGIHRTQRLAGEMWNWHDGKIALEYLFYTGRIGAARRINFERRYDLLERILPPAVISAPTPSRAQAQRELVRIAARALGVASEPALGDYFRLPRADSRARVSELVARGELLPVEVEGWRAPAYLWPQARRPRQLRARALLCPFDPLIFFRPRVERLFDFRYRVEIYVPAARRVHGYYVLPFLLDERLVARVDLKSDREAGALLVQGAFAEAGVDRSHVARELAAELRLVAEWLELPRGVRVGARGDLVGALQREL